MPEVSVIIPTYGEPDLLERCVNSALQQTVKDIEVIVVDDNDPGTAARKQTELLMEQLSGSDSRIVYLKHPKNKNGAAARNTGLSAAKGEYISFLDSDDEYLPERLECCLNALKDNDNKRIAGVYTGCEFRRNGTKYTEFTDVQAGNHLKDTLASTFMFCTGSNIFMKRNVFDELNGFDECFLRHQDYEFLVRYFEKYDLAAIKMVLVIKNNDNKNLPSPEKMVEIKKQYLDKYKYIIDNMSKEDKDYIYQMQFILIAEGYVNKKQFKAANEYYKKAAAIKSIPINRIYRRFALTMRAAIKRS